MATQATQYYNPYQQANAYPQTTAYAQPYQPANFAPFDEAQAIDNVNDVINSLDVYQGNDATRPGEAIKPMNWKTVRAVVVDCLPAILELVAALLNAGKPTIIAQSGHGIGNSAHVTYIDNGNKKDREDKNQISTAAGLAAGAAAGGGIYAAGAAYRSYFGWSKKLNNATAYAQHLISNDHAIKLHAWASHVKTINTLYTEVLNNIISDQRYKLAILAGIAVGGGIALFGYIFATKVAFTIGTAVGASAGLAGLWRLGTGDLNSDETNAKIKTIRSHATWILTYPTQPQQPHVAPQPSAPPYVVHTDPYFTATYQAQYPYQGQ